MNETLIGKDGAEMVLIPQGKFAYGISDDQLSNLGYGAKAIKEYRRDYFEILPQDAYTPDYYIDKFPVTNAQYETFLKATKRRKRPRLMDSSLWGAPSQPIIGVDWQDATDYANWCGKRLGTEQEWEKAARGPDGRLFPWGNEADRVICNSAESGLECTSAVGSFPLSASAYGVHDMAGNVWEMTTGHWTSESLAMRGGCFLTYIRFCRSTARWAPDKSELEKGPSWLGFRCVQDV
jgi:toxoflavin biosynthesis protein ToxD